MASFAPLRHAGRALRRTPVFTATASLTLVIGIAASIAIFAVVNGVLLKPLPYGNPERLVGVWHDLAPVNLFKIQHTPGTYGTYKRLATTIEGIGLYEHGAVNVAEPGGSGEPQRLTTANVTSDLIPLLQVPTLLGRVFTDDEDRVNGPPVAMISAGLWHSRFGTDRNILGRTMDINGVSTEIIGVMPEGFNFPDAQTQLWLPLRLPEDASGGFNWTGIARLKPGVTIAEAQRDLAAVLPRMPELYPNFVPGVTTAMLMEQTRPVPVVSSMHDDVTGSVASTLWMIAIAAGLVLLVACANVTNLILVRADGRQRELAVREALGGRRRVLIHLLSEAVVLASIATAAGMAIAWFVLRALVLSGPLHVPRLSEVGFDATTLVFAGAILLLVIVLCTAVPVLRIGHLKLSNALREGGRGGTAGRIQQRVRGALVAAQIAIALVVVAGSGLLLRSFRQLSAVDPGFETQGVATLWLSPPAARYPDAAALGRFYAELDDRLAQLPGVTAAGLTSRIPLTTDGMNQSPLYPDDDPSYANKVPPIQLYASVDGDYFRVMGIRLLAGRTFDKLNLQRPRDAVVSSKTAMQFWKDSTGALALGKTFRTLPGGPQFTVVGVVESIRDTSIAGAATSAVYVPQVADTADSEIRRAAALTLKTSGDPQAIVRSAQQVIREMDPGLPTFSVRAMDDVYTRSMAQLRFTMMILSGAAGVALVLGAIGLYGVMAYAVTLRTRELGVRIALGAQPRAVAGMIAKQGILLGAIGTAAGLVVFVVLARFLNSFLYGVAATDPLTLGLASLVLVSVAAIASWAPSRRAVRVDPTEALRSD